MFSQLDNLFPPEYATTFQPMLMQAPKSSFEDVKSIVEEELGQKIDDLFSHFEKTPIASASLG